MRRIPLIFLVIAASGCGATVREPARDAALGVMDSIERPPPDAVLAGKLGKLVDRYVDRALEAGAPPSIEEISGSAVRGALKEIGDPSAAAPRLAQNVARGLVRGIGRDAQTVDTLERAAAGAGRALASGVSGELASEMSGWVGPNAEGPLADAMAALAARSAEAAIAGSMRALRADLDTCVPGEGQTCIPDVARVLSRSAARGASEGVKRGIDWATVSIAFVTGLASAVGAGFLVSVIRDRRRMRV